MSKDPTIFVVDDDPAVLDSLQALLGSIGFQVESYDSGEAFLKAYSPTRSGCLVLDLYLPGLNGLEIQKYLSANQIDLPVIVITAHSDVHLAVQSMKAGAVDFIQKPFEEEVILKSIDHALTLGERSRNNESLSDIASASMSRLTSRERDVLEQLVFGRTNKMIASHLEISPRTVEIHRAHIMEKMEAHSLPHLVRLALAGGVEP